MTILLRINGQTAAQPGVLFERPPVANDFVTLPNGLHQVFRVIHTWGDDLQDPILLVDLAAVVTP